MLFRCLFIKMCVLCSEWSSIHGTSAVLNALGPTLLTYPMVQNIAWKAISHSGCKKILLSFWNPKVHHRVHNSPPLDTILRQPNLVRLIDPYLPNVQLNVILPPTPRSSQWSLTFGPPNQNPLNTSPLPHACHMSHPPRPPWFNHTSNIRWRIQAVKFISMQLPPRPIYVPFMSKYFRQHSVLRNSQSMFLSQSERPSFAPVQRSRQNYSFVYFNL
jgi:hypothetical protein